MVFAPTQATAERRAFYERIDKDSVTPLWEVLGSLVPAYPATPCVPALWRYAIAAFIQLLPGRFDGRAYRSTDGTVFSIVEGRGRSTVGDVTFEWGPKDIFVVPSWTTVSHEANEDAVLFSYSDRPVQKALGLWREEMIA